MSLPALQTLASQPNLVRKLVHDYNEAVSALEATVAGAQRLYRFTQSLNAPMHFDRHISLWRLSGSGVADDWKAKLTAAAWMHVLNSTSALNRLSSSQRDAYERKFQSFQGQPFTEENVLDLVGIVASAYERTHLQSVLDAFDEMTRNARNRCGWKGGKSYATNSAYAVGKKVILASSYVLDQRYNTWSSVFRRGDHLDDIDRALAYLTGKRWEDVVSLKSAIESWVRGTGEEDAESTFFRVRPFQNGNVHVWWLDEELRQRFNVTVARERGWLPHAESTAA